MPNVQNSPVAPGLDQAFLEMRARCLSLAADLDRLDRLVGKSAHSDPRMTKLLQAVNVLLTDSRPDRAARVQMIFTDVTPPPPYGNAKHL